MCVYSCVNSAVSQSSKSFSSDRLSGAVRYSRTVGNGRAVAEPLLKSVSSVSSTSVRKRGLCWDRHQLAVRALSDDRQALRNLAQRVVIADAEVRRLDAVPAKLGIAGLGPARCQEPQQTGHTGPGARGL